MTSMPYHDQFYSPGLLQDNYMPAQASMENVGMDDQDTPLLANPSQNGTGYWAAQDSRPSVRGNPVCVRLPKGKEAILFMMNKCLPRDHMLMTKDDFMQMSRSVNNPLKKQVRIQFLKHSSFHY